MNTKDLIAIQRFCDYYDVPVSFINDLHEIDLIDLVHAENNIYIHKRHIHIIEKMMRLHYELDINLEGVDVIHNLLNQIELLQHEIKILKNKLDFYDDK